MRVRSLLAVVVAVTASLGLSSCKKPVPTPQQATNQATGDMTATTSLRPVKLDGLPRADFNRRAAELALPLFWRSDANQDGALNPDELVVLWGMGDSARNTWVDEDAEHGAGFARKMEEAHALMMKPTDLASLPPAEQKRVRLVLEELRQGRPTLIETDLTNASAEDQAVVQHIQEAAQLVEAIYARQNGLDALTEKPQDPASRALFHRNQGPRCVAPKTEKDPDCSALPQKPKMISGLYPARLQTGDDTAFCAALEKHPDADQLLHQFHVVKEQDGKLVAVPYHQAFQPEVAQVSAKLKEAAAAIQDPKEAAFKAYLEAAAQAFVDDSWFVADQAWKDMNANNSKWYLRIGPDETYFEPCSRKAGFHVSFARINPDSLAWQQKLEPVKKEMEQSLARLAGPPYRARDVKFQLPDFIDIVINAGDARNAHGATIGQSLPNWGPVAAAGGRTVAMTNLYTDKDSEDAWTEQVASLLCAETNKKVRFDNQLAVMSTVLHEAAHNLGPAHEYKVKGKTDDQAFGGPLASMLEELKSQTAALWFADWLVGKGIIDQATADGAHLRDVTWAFGHIAQGMVTADGKPKAYSQLAAIQLGTLAKDGVLVWKAEEQAANGKDRGCFEVDLGRWKGSVDRLAKTVLGIKARGDRAAAERLQKEMVDDSGAWSEQRAIIEERWLRAPKASFVYAIRR